MIKLEKTLLKLIVALSLATIICCNSKITNNLSYISAIGMLEKEISISEMDDFLKRTMDSLNIPGMSIAIINNGEIAYHRATGISNVDTGTKVNDSTIFEAASLSKPVFAYFALKMAEKGVFDLDRPLYFYLNDKSMDVDPRFRRVNARMVLNHTTGFPNWRWFDTAPPEMNITRGNFFMKADPGTFTYSGEGYQYLARVLAHNNFLNMYELGGLFEKEVTRPLDIQHTYFVWDDFLHENKAWGHENGEVDYKIWGSGLPHHHSKFFEAAGGLHTEAINYAKFLISIMDEKGLRDITFDLMFSEQVQLPKDHRYFKNDNTSAWSLGMAIEKSEGKTYYKHGGNNGGFQSDFLIDKGLKNGYVFFTNCDRGEEFNLALRSFLNIK